MSVVWYALWFVIAVGLLVTVHEFGHFWVARRLGFKVLRFSVGFGKPLWKYVHPEGHEYWISPLPLGGYVKLLDEREGPVAPHELARSFTRRPPWQRIVVLLAGPAFNILFAVLLLWGMLWVNGVTEVRPLVGEVTAGSVAATAGLRSGDEIRAINAASVAGERDVVFGLLDAMSARGEAALSVRRSGIAQRVQLQVLSEQVAGKRIGRIHVTQPPGRGYPESMLRHTELGAAVALARAGGEAWTMSVLQARLFWRMVLGRVTLKNLSGPLSIAEFAGESAEAGVAAFLGFLVLISLSLGFLNLLPIPILDGGQIVFQLVEWLDRKSTRLNSSHLVISYAVFCLKKKTEYQPSS